MGLSPESHIRVKADAMIGAEGSTEAPQETWRQGFTGVEDQGTKRDGSPRNLGGPAHSSSNQQGDDLPTTSRPGRAVFARTGSRKGTRKEEHRRGTAKRRKRSAAGRCAGSPSRPYELRGRGTAPGRDPEEQRGDRAREPRDRKMNETLNSCDISTRIERIAELARKHPERIFHSLHHAVDMQWMVEAAGRVRKDAAAGADGQTWDEYSKDLEGNLRDLLDRFKSGTYRAPPVRRVYIPKGDGRSRPIGIPIPAANYTIVQQGALGNGHDHAADPSAGGPAADRRPAETAERATVCDGAASRREPCGRAARLDRSLAVGACRIGRALGRASTDAGHRRRRRLEEAAR